MKKNKFRRLQREQDAYLKEAHDKLEELLRKMDPYDMLRFLFILPIGEYAEEATLMIWEMRKGKDLDWIIRNNLPDSLDVFNHMKIRMALVEMKNEFIRLRLCPLD